MALVVPLSSDGSVGSFCLSSGGGFFIFFFPQGEGSQSGFAEIYLCGCVPVLFVWVKEGSS